MPVNIRQDAEYASQETADAVMSGICAAIDRAFERGGEAICSSAARAERAGRKHQDGLPKAPRQTPLMGWIPHGESVYHLVIRLPMPPSVNGSYANVPGKGRVATKALRSWKATAAAEILRAISAATDRPVFRGCVEIVVRLPVPARGEPDADNRIKPVQDALVAAGVIADDSWRYVASSAARWVYDGSLGDHIEVTVSQIAQEPATRAKSHRQAHAEGQRKRPATRQRRASETTSPKRPSPTASSAASETAVQVAIASRLNIDPKRIHIMGGTRG